MSAAYWHRDRSEMTLERSAAAAHINGAAYQHVARIVA